MLTEEKIKGLRSRGKYADRDNLYLNISKQGNKSWIYRFQLKGRRREMGLGSLEGTPLMKARELASDARKLHKQGIDPKECRDKRKHTSEEKSFRVCAEAYIESHKSSWKCDKHISQWTNTLSQYVYPTIGDLPINEIDTEKVLGVLQPIWNSHFVTARRIRGRIESILDWAIPLEFQDRPNPALWKGNLSILLPRPSRNKNVIHHLALPYQEMPMLLEQFDGKRSNPSLALKFTILTAARTNEVIGARWDEVDFDKLVWTIPAERTKSGREHRVPLSKQARSLMADMSRENEWLFPGSKKNSHLSSQAMLQFLRRKLERPNTTVHGFRSSFKDWAAELTEYPKEIAGMALAHSPNPKVEADYQRGDLLEKRRQLMQDWADFSLKTTELEEHKQKLKEEKLIPDVIQKLNIEDKKALYEHTKGLVLTAKAFDNSDKDYIHSTLSATQTNKALESIEKLSLKVKRLLACPDNSDSIHALNAKFKASNKVFLRGKRPFVHFAIEILSTTLTHAKELVLANEKKLAPTYKRRKQAARVLQKIITSAKKLKKGLEGLNLNVRSTLNSQYDQFGEPIDTNDTSQLDQFLIMNLDLIYSYCDSLKEVDSRINQFLYFDVLVAKCFIECGGTINFKHNSEFVTYYEFLLKECHLPHHSRHRNYKSRIQHILKHLDTSPSPPNFP